MRLLSYSKHYQSTHRQKQNYLVCILSYSSTAMFWGPMYKLNRIYLVGVYSFQSCFLFFLDYESIFLNISLSKYHIRSWPCRPSGLWGLVSGDQRERTIVDILVTTHIMILSAQFRALGPSLQSLYTWPDKGHHLSNAWWPLWPCLWPPSSKFPKQLTVIAWCRVTHFVPFRLIREVIWFQNIFSFQSLA